MKLTIALAFFASLFLSACGGSDDGPDGGPPDARACANLVGTWSFSYTCGGDGGGGLGGSFLADVTQVGCGVRLTQADDNTTTTWVSSGAIEGGDLTLTGEFGFTTASSCAGTVTDEEWTFACTSGEETCTGTAQKL